MQKPLCILQSALLVIQNHGNTCMARMTFFRIVLSKVARQLQCLIHSRHKIIFAQCEMALKWPKDVESS